MTTALSPLSDDPAKRERQLANLRPGAGQWTPGASPALRHGLRTRKPPGLVISPIVDEIREAIGESLPIRGPDGGVPAVDHYALELAAIALLRVRRCNNFLAIHGEVDERNNLRPEWEAWGRAVTLASNLLDKLGCSPRSRAALGLDIARGQQADLSVVLAAARAEPDAELRRAMLARAGLVDGDTLDAEAEDVLDAGDRLDNGDQEDDDSSGGTVEDLFGG